MTDPDFEPAAADPDFEHADLDFEPESVATAVPQTPKTIPLATARNPGSASFGPLDALSAGLGWVGDKARRGMNAAYDVNRSLPPSLNPLSGTPVLDAAEMLSRSSLTPTLGMKMMEGQPDENKLAGLNALESKLGENGTTAALVIPHLIGQAPQMALGLGWAGKGAAGVKALQLEGKVLPKIAQLGAEALGSSAEGAFMGGAQGAIAGEDVKGSALGGALAGGGLHLAGAGAKALGDAAGRAVKGKFRKVGTLAADLLDRMADEVGFLKEELPQGEPKFLKGPSLDLSHEVQAGGDGLTVTARDQNGNKIGSALLSKKGDSWSSALVSVEPEYRRQGVASSMYKYVESVTGEKVSPSGFQTPEGEALWKGNAAKQQFGAAPVREPAPSIPTGPQKVRPGDLEPSFITIHPDEQGGVVATVNELTASGGHKYYDVPIKNGDDALRIGKLADSRKLSVAWGEGMKDSFGHMPDEIIKGLNWRKNQVWDAPAPASSLKGTNPGIPKRKSADFSNLDRPATIKRPDAQVLVDGSGHVKVSPLPEPDFDTAALPKPGDEVAVIGSGTKRFRATYQGINPVTNQAVVALGPRLGHEGPFDMGDLGNTAEVPVGRVIKADPMVPGEPGSPGFELPPGGGQRPPGKGDYGFISNPAGGYHPVQILGKGDKAGTLSVTLGPGSRPVQMDAAKVDSRLPPGIHNLDELIPPGPDAPLPGTVENMHPADAEELDASRRVFENLSRKEPTAWAKAMKQLLGGQVRGPRVMQEMHLRNQGSQALLKAEGDHFAAIESRLPSGPIRKEFNNDLGKLFENKLKWEDMVNKYGDQATEALKDISGKMADTRTANDKRIAELGGIPDSLILERAEGLLDPYLARQYMVHLLPPGEWAKRVSKMHPEVFQRAVDFLVKDLSQEGKFHVLPEQVSAELETLLKSPNVAESLKASGLKEAKAFKRLLARQDIPSELKAVMGEVTAGSVRMASTLGSQEAIIAKLEMFQDIANDPNLSSIGRRADLHPEPVPEVPRLFGKLAGRYVKPEIYDELINLPNSVRNMYTFANKIAGWVKGNQLTGFGPWWTSLSGNIQGGVYSGGLSFLRPDQYAQDFKGALRAIKDYHADPTGRTGDGWLVKEAKKLGADWSGRGEVEINSTSRKFVKQMLESLDTQPEGAFSMMNTLKEGMDQYQKVPDAFGNALDAQDRAFRIASYISLRRKFLAKGMAPEEAGLTAARRIANSFPNPEHLGAAVKAMRSMVGVAAPYLTPKAEDLRIYSLLPKRMLEEPDLKYRLLGHAVLFGGAAKMLQHFSGVNSESLAAAQESMTKKSRAFKSALIPLVTRDAQGRPQFLDVTNWFLPFQLLQGHPDDPWFKRVAYNFATFPFEGGLAQDTLDTLAEEGGAKRPMSKPPLLEGEGSPGRLMDKLFRYGFGPRYVSTIMDVGRKTMVGGTYDQPQTLGPGNLGRNEEPMTPGQGALQLGGLKVQGVGDRGFRAAAMEGVGEIKNLASGQLISLWKSSRTPEEKQRITQAIIERIRFLGQQRANAGAAIEARELANALTTQ